MVDLAREFPHVAYVKEESAPLVERMTAELARRPPLKGIFGASFADGWLYEMRLGLDGVMTGMAMYADLMARMWELHVRGEADALRDAYSRFLLMRNLNEQIPGVDLYVMKKTRHLQDHDDTYRRRRGVEAETAHADAAGESPRSNTGSRVEAILEPLAAGISVSNHMETPAEASRPTSAVLGFTNCDATLEFSVSQQPATRRSWPARRVIDRAAWPCDSPPASRGRCSARTSAGCDRRAGTSSIAPAP
jgi:hypothetical protein